MPYSDEAQRLRDIVENIDNALSCVGGRGHAALAAEQMRVDAVEHCIERMAEAIVKIGEARMAGIAPEVLLPGVRQFGNILRHEYGEVDTRLVHAIVVDRMPGCAMPVLRSSKRLAVSTSHFNQIRVTVHSWSRNRNRSLVAEHLSQRC